MPDKLLENPASNATWADERATVLSTLLVVKNAVAQISKDTSEIRVTLETKYHENERAIIEIQKNCAVRDIGGQHLTLRLTGLDEAMVETSERLKALEKLAPVIKIVSWIGAALGVSVIGLIWALITGQAAISF